MQVGFLLSVFLILSLPAGNDLIGVSVTERGISEVTMDRLAKLKPIIEDLKATFSASNATDVVLKMAGLFNELSDIISVSHSNTVMRSSKDGFLMFSTTSSNAYFRIGVHMSRAVPQMIALSNVTSFCGHQSFWPTSAPRHDSYSGYVLPPIKGNRFLVNYWDPEVDYHGIYQEKASCEAYELRKERIQRAIAGLPPHSVLVIPPALCCFGKLSIPFVRIDRNLLDYETVYYPKYYITTSLMVVPKMMQPSALKRDDMESLRPVFPLLTFGEDAGSLGGYDEYKLREILELSGRHPRDVDNADN